MSTGWSCRGPRFDSQHLCGSLQPSVTPVPERSEALSWPRQALQTCGTQTTALACKIPTDIKFKEEGGGGEEEEKKLKFKILIFYVNYLKDKDIFN